MACLHTYTHTAMKSTLRLAAAAGALLGLVALPGANAAACSNSPYTMDDAKTSTDLNTLLSSWSGQGCTGVINFTATSPKTYTLTNSYTMVNNAAWTLDGSGSAGVIIVSALNKRIFDTTVNTISGASLVVKGLTFQGSGGLTGGTNVAQGACFRLYGPSFVATDCVFQSFKSDADGGAIYVTNRFVNRVQR